MTDLPDGEMVFRDREFVLVLCLLWTRYRRLKLQPSVMSKLVDSEEISSDVKARTLLCTAGMSPN